MAIKKKASKKYKFCILQDIKTYNNLYVSSSFDLTSVSIISSNEIAESPIILAKYFLFSQLHVAGFQI